MRPSLHSYEWRPLGALARWNAEIASRQRSPATIDALYRAACAEAAGAEAAREARSLAARANAATTTADALRLAQCAAVSWRTASTYRRAAAEIIVAADRALSGGRVA